MQEKIEAIYEIIKDYRNEDGIFITQDDIQTWGEQFGPHTEFMLNEVLHLLKQVYLSKADARKALQLFVDNHIQHYKFPSFESYLENTCFLQLQPKGKSQQVLLKMLDELIFDKNGHHIQDYADHPKTLYVYLDDILATGGTIRNDLIKWLEQDNHLKKIQERTINLELSIICVHTWGLNFLLFGLQQKFGTLTNLGYSFCYTIQNHLKFYNQDLNIAIPVKEGQSQEVIQYLSKLTAEKYEDYAFRNEFQPKQEVFSSSPENRIKYENILLEKGLYIINQIRGPIRPNIRPLGLINPKYKTFGLGTHFFTWRNVPNNCPLVFWWQVDGHNWKPLFPAKRGIY